MALTKSDALTTGAYLGVEVGLGVLLGSGVTVAVGEAVTGAATVTTDGVEMVAVAVGPAGLVAAVAAVAEVVVETGAGLGAENPAHPLSMAAIVSRQAR